MHNLFVSKMDSDLNVQDYESRAKRLKLEFEDTDIGGMCDNVGFPRFSHAARASIDSGEGKISKICFDCLGILFNSTWRLQTKRLFDIK